MVDANTIIAAINARYDLVELVARHSPGGNGRLWACPKHGRAPSEGGTPSLSIYADGRRWKCHGCDTHGTAVDFLALVEGCTVADLIRRETHGGALQRAQSVPRGPGRPPAPQRPPRNVEALWTRAVARGRAAGPDDMARAYLGRRLGSDEIARALLEDERCGIVAATDPDWWVAQKARDGYGLAVPMYVSPPPGEVLQPPRPATLALRWCRDEAPPAGEPKITRLPATAVGEVVTYGYPPGAVLEADGNTLYIVEGAFDYLTLRAAGVAAVIGLFSTSGAEKYGHMIRAEIEAVRSFGVGGPVQVVLADQNDVASSRAMTAIARALVALRGVKLSLLNPNQLVSA